MAEQARPNAVLRGGLRAVTMLARALGPARYPVADAIAGSVYAFQPGRRHRAAANHRRADPDIDVREARRRARRSFLEYGRTAADFLWANGMDDAEVRSISVVHNLEAIRAAQRAGSGGILALSHFGNWDMAANIACAQDIQLTTVMAPLGPRAITDLVIYARERNALEVFTPENAARGLLRAVRRNRFVALLCDIPGGGPTVLVDYCGGPVEFSAAPAWLAQRTGAPLFPVVCRRGGPGYEIIVHPAVHAGRDEDAAVVMQRVATSLETAVRERPEQWYPFGPVYRAEARG